MSRNRVNRRVRLSQGNRAALWGLAFALPAVAYLLIFSVYPIVQSLYFSFTNYSLSPRFDFVGLNNYLKVISSGSFHNALRVSLVYVFGTVVPVWFMAFGLALLLNQIRRLSGVARTLVFLPTVLPLLSVALVWKLFFNIRGPMNALLSSVGIAPVAWLTQSAYAPLALIIASWWHAPSYYMILFLAGLQAIPNVYHEAAALDGANYWQRLRHIVLPLMRPTILLVVVLSIINGFRTFAFQQVMTNGGPGDATEIMTLLIYKTAFNFGNMGEAAAMSILYFALILVFSLIQLRILRGGDGYA